MHASKKHPHHTPCGLVLTLKLAQHETWTLYCAKCCPTASQPFCFDDEPAKKCKQFHMHHGARPTAKPKPALNQASLHELDTQKHLF